MACAFSGKAPYPEPSQPASSSPTTKPSSAYLMAGPKRRSHSRSPCSSDMASQAFRLPGVATTGAPHLLAGPWTGSASRSVVGSCVVASSVSAGGRGFCVVSPAGLSSRAGPSSLAPDPAPQEHSTPRSSASRRILEPPSRSTPSDPPSCLNAPPARLRLEPFEVLLAELRDLRRDHDLAIRLVRVVPVVLLVVVLGDVERLERRHLGDYGVVPDALGLDLRDELLGDAALLLVVVEDRGSVLRPDVGALPVQRRGVVDGEENLQDLPERDRLRIERDLNDLRVSRSPGN